MNIKVLLSKAYNQIIELNKKNKKIFFFNIISFSIVLFNLFINNKETKNKLYKTYILLLITTYINIIFFLYKLKVKKREQILLEYKNEIKIINDHYDELRNQLLISQEQQMNDYYNMSFDPINSNNSTNDEE